MFKVSAIIIGFISLWTFLAEKVILKNRISDERIYKIFKAKNVPIQIYDTVINGSHIHYAISGKEDLPTLVFIHGSPGSWMNYMKFMWDERLNKKFRIVSIDRPGFGYSDFGKAKHLQEQTDLLLPVLQSIKKSSRMILCGHSLGGPLIVNLAADAPTLFSKIIIVAGALDVKQEKPEKWRYFMNKELMMHFMPGAFAPSNTELLYLKEDLIPLQEKFNQVICDVQFIHGDKDSWVPIQNVGYGIEKMIHAKSNESDTIFGGIHQLPWFSKDEFTELLAK
jgi:dipeptidyl aminopeptidase/acylaminoacyl peptidase